MLIEKNVSPARSAALVIGLDDEFYATMDSASTRERDRRASVARAAARIASKEPRYSQLTIETAVIGHVLRIDRRVDMPALDGSVSRA